MTTRYLQVVAVALCAFLIGMPAMAQSNRPYKEGPVTELSYIKIKPGQYENYMKYLAGPYKSLLEAEKKAGLIIGYAVYGTTARSPSEPDLILAVTFPNMAALDKSEEFEALAAKVVGDEATQSKGMIDRGAMREVLGSQIIRVLVLK